MSIMQDLNPCHQTYSEYWKECCSNMNIKRGILRIWLSKGVHLKNIFLHSYIDSVWPWGWGLKNTKRGPLFSGTFDNSRTHNVQALSVAFAPRVYNSYNHAHAPGPHMWLSPGPGPNSKSSKNGSRIFVLKVQTLSGQDRYFPNPGRRKLKESAGI